MEADSQAVDTREVAIPEGDIQVVAIQGDDNQAVVNREVGIRAVAFPVGALKVVAAREDAPFQVIEQAGPQHQVGFRHLDDCHRLVDSRLQGGCRHPVGYLLRGDCQDVDRQPVIGMDDHLRPVAARVGFRELDESSVGLSKNHQPRRLRLVVLKDDPGRESHSNDHLKDVVLNRGDRLMDGKVDQVEMKAVLLMADRSTGWRDDPWMAYLSTEPMDVVLDWMDAEMMVDVALALMDVAWVSTDVA